MVEGPRDGLVSIEKSLQSMNDLDIHPRSSQLLRLNGRTSYHFLFVGSCFNVLGPFSTHYAYHFYELAYRYYKGFRQQK